MNSLTDSKHRFSDAFIAEIRGCSVEDVTTIRQALKAEKRAAQLVAASLKYRKRKKAVLDQLEKHKKRKEKILRIWDDYRTCQQVARITGYPIAEVEQIVSNHRQVKLRYRGYSEEYHLINRKIRKR